MFTTSDEHLEYFLVLAGVLLRVVERVVKFLEDHIRDVRMLQHEFRQYGMI